MLRVTTLYASSAGATAAYYTKYLAAAPGEIPGRWAGAQAAGLGLSGDVSTDQLELLLSGHDPTTGAGLGHELTDRLTSSGTVIRAVAGFDATFSAPKSLSVWWALTGDDGLAACHDAAVSAAVEYVERFGSTTRVRSNGSRLHPDSQGLIAAAFRQTTSRLDDPQLHTHVVISSKVQTVDGRWLALDARVLKQHQRAIGGLYQSVLRAEITRRYGVQFAEVVSGQAEIAGVPAELLAVFSKRSAQVDAAVAVELDEFRRREGRSPTRFERAAMERQIAADTRPHKSGDGVPDLQTRWRDEAASVGVSAESLTASIAGAAATLAATGRETTVGEVIADLSSSRSAWHRMDIVRAVTDRVAARPDFDADRWVAFIDRCVERVMDRCVDLDPPGPDIAVRVSDGRSLSIEPVAAHITSGLVLAQEEWILSWALDAQLDEPRPSSTVVAGRLDVVQRDAAAAVAGWDQLAVVVGPAGAGKTSMLAAAVTDLHRNRRPVMGLAPTAKAARVLNRDTGVAADTVAKLLHDWDRPTGPTPEWRLPPGTTLIVDEAGMLSTPNLHHLVQLAEQQQWRLVLVGDPHQLQGVGRGGMFAELVTASRHVELERIHRFTTHWEAAASLMLRHGQPAVLGVYQAFDRIHAGAIGEHLDTIVATWNYHHARGETLAITTTTNDHVDLINHTIHSVRLRLGDLDFNRSATTVDGTVFVGDVIATRRNDRHIQTSDGEMIRNRQLWTISDVDSNGNMTVSQIDGHDTATLPADYVAEHVRLGYAATEPGNQSDTFTASITLASDATTGRGLYVGMTRGRERNDVLVITDNNDRAEARDTLERILNSDRADTPATRQRRILSQQHRRQAPSAPSPQPRCTIPDWVNELQREAIDTRDQFRTALVEEHEQRHQIVANVRHARNTYEAADRAAAPYDEPLRTAFTAVQRAEDRLRTARRDVEQARIFRRGRPQAELADARDHHAKASSQLAQLEAAAKPYLDDRRLARDTLNQHQESLRSFDLISSLDNYVQRLETVSALAAGLTSWRAWASGQDVDPDTLKDCVTNLDTSASHDAHDLANVLRTWAHRTGLDLGPRPPQPSIERDLSIGIEL